MSMKAAKWVFWLGTLSSLVLFLALTVDTHGQFAALTHADKLDEHGGRRQAGVREYNCNDCHTILGFGGYYAPDLTRAYTRLGEDAIKRRLEQPEVVFADSYRKMPQQNRPPAEIDEHTAASSPGWTGSTTTTGRRTTRRRAGSARPSGCWRRRRCRPAAALVEQEGCLTCHALGDRGESEGPAPRARRLARATRRGSATTSPIRRSSPRAARCPATGTSRPGSAR